MSRAIVIVGGPVSVDTDSLRLAATALGWQRGRVGELVASLQGWQVAGLMGAGVSVATPLPTSLGARLAGLAAELQVVAQRVRAQVDEPLRELGMEVNLAADIYDEAEACAGELGSRCALGGWGVQGGGFDVGGPMQGGQGIPGGALRAGGDFAAGRTLTGGTLAELARLRANPAALGRLSTYLLWRIFSDQPSRRQAFAQSALLRIAYALEALESVELAARLTPAALGALTEFNAHDRLPYLATLSLGAADIARRHRAIGQPGPSHALVRGVGPLERIALRLSLSMDALAASAGRRTQFLDVARSLPPGAGAAAGALATSTRTAPPVGSGNTGSPNTPAATGGRSLTNLSRRGWPTLAIPAPGARPIPTAHLAPASKLASALAGTVAAGNIPIAGSGDPLAFIPRHHIRQGLYGSTRSHVLVNGIGMPTAAGAAVATPRGAADLLQRVDYVRSHPWSEAAAQPAAGDTSDIPQAGEFEILRHDTPGQSRPSWTVVMRGTQETRIGATNPKDMLSNFATVAGAHSEEHAAVKIALADLGAAPNDAVEFVGHSQGGLTAASLAADPQVHNQYRVASVVTAGSPVATLAVPGDTPMLSFENSADVIAGLEGRFNSGGANHVTVYAAGEKGQSFFAPHSLGGYVADAQEAARREDPAIAAWSERRRAALGLSDATVTTPHRYTITRTRVGP